jgi:hypothetical protein
MMAYIAPKPSLGRGRKRGGEGKMGPSPWKQSITRNRKVSRLMISKACEGRCKRSARLNARSRKETAARGLKTKSLASPREMRFGARRSMSLGGGTAPQEGRRRPLKSRLLLANVATPATNSVGPDALGVPGPCFAARETSGMLQMISWRKNAWPSRPPPSMFGQRFKRAPFRSGISSGDDASTLVTPGSFPLVRRSHGYPVFLPRLEIGRRCVAFACLFMTTR